MSKTNQEVSLPDELILNQIYVIREQKVMLDKDLAELYGVETRVLNQAVRRNIDRFPKDFMFELTPSEYESLRSQFVTLKTRGSHSKYLPHVFTEQGVAMLSSVLNSKQAIQVNIQIMRIFTKMRQMLSDHTALKLDLAEIKQVIHKIMKKQDGQDKNIDLLFGYIDQLQEKVEEPKQDRKRVGYKNWEK
nr:ORF6N domain-containing protein [Pseudopedobacter sp.]